MSATPTWTKYSFTYSSFSAAALTNTIELVSLSAGSIIHGVKIKHNTAFSGGAISAYSLTVGIVGDLAKYAASFDVFQAVADDTFNIYNNFDSQNHATNLSVKVTATSVGANLSAATAGAVDIWLLVSQAV